MAQLKFEFKFKCKLELKIHTLFTMDVHWDCVARPEYRDAHCADEPCMPMAFLPPDEADDTLDLIAMLDELIAECASECAARPAATLLARRVRKPLAVITDECEYRHR